MNFIKKDEIAAKFLEFWQKFKKHYKLVVSWFDDDWYDVHLDANMNHGQGSWRDEE